ncbi:MAG: class I SAM-dependent methyltransferase [Gemmatimonadaceae bacterium]
MVLSKIASMMRRMTRAPQEAKSILRTLPAIVRASEFARRWEDRTPTAGATRAAQANPLRDFFDARTTGAGVWKWRHYFDIYHRHLEKFVGRDVHLLEIGVYSGGSLEMWREYLGAKSVIHGVDIAAECTVYESANVHISIGDQQDPEFWARFREKTPQLDVVIDDGGHTPGQQIVTLEELLPHLRPGGVFLCEDVHGFHHEFAAYVGGLVGHLNRIESVEGAELAATPVPFQRGVYAIHFYPYVVVIERTDAAPVEFVAPKRGTDWQPFSV